MSNKSCYASDLGVMFIN